MAELSNVAGSSALPRLGTFTAQLLAAARASGTWGLMALLTANAQLEDDFEAAMQPHREEEVIPAFAPHHGTHMHAQL